MIFGKFFTPALNIDFFLQAEERKTTHWATAAGQLL
jgi:hypothetical protein